MAEDKNKQQTAAEKAAAKKAEAERVAAEKAAAEKEEATYIMKVTHLSWGRNSLNHFYAEKKPLINEKVMGKYAGTLQIWLKKGWIEEGKY